MEARAGAGKGMRGGPAHAQWASSRSRDLWPSRGEAAAEQRQSRMRPALAVLLLSAMALSGASAQPGGLPQGRKLKMAYATGPLLKFQIW